MSVIGPRPALWNQDVLIAEREKYHANDVKPGLTGWAQINGRDGQIKEQGYPRNSIFFDQNKRQSIKKRYGLEGKISIFYMPTWRGTANGIDDVDQVSEMERLAKA